MSYRTAASTSRPRGLVSGGDWRRLNKDIPYLSDVILHQMFVERVSNLQPTDEGDSDYVFFIVVY